MLMGDVGVGFGQRRAWWQVDGSDGKKSMQVEERGRMFCPGYGWDKIGSWRGLGLKLREWFGWLVSLRGKVE